MTVRIETDPEDRAEVAKILLDAAKSDPSVVRTDTNGSTLAFVVPDEIAASAGYGAPEIAEPPRTGKGSGIGEWRKFLTEKKIDFDPEIKERDDLIDLYDEHNKTIG